MGDSTGPDPRHHTPGVPTGPPDPTGHVAVGGPAWRWDTAAWTVRKIAVSAMDNDVYLITCAQTGEQLLVDAADDAAAIADLVATGTGGLQVVVTTHQHWDHHRALPEVVRTFGATTAAGRADAAALPVGVDRPLEHGDTVQVGRLVLGVIALRGHTPGSVALSLQAPGGQVALFTGDSLFPGGPGMTTTAADFTSLLDDLESRVFAEFGDDTLVLPGHGDNTTLGQERPHLGQWRARGW